MKAPNVLRVACAMLMLSVGPGSLGAVTSLRLDSGPGEFLGGGEFNFYTTDDGRIEPAPWSPATSEEVQLMFRGPIGPLGSPFNLSWQLWFAAPPGETLAVGSYDDAIAPYRRGPGQPGLQVSGNASGCLGVTGRFEVKQIGFDQDGLLSRFWATFEQNCGGVLRGEVRFNADVPVEIHGPSHRTAQEGRALEFDVQGHDALGNAAALSATGLPSGASFNDGEDGTGRFAWLPESGQAGSSGWVAFTGESAGGDTDVVYARIDAIPDFDDFDHPIPIPTLPFKSTVYQPVAGAAADDPVCPPTVGGSPEPPPAPDQGSVWYSFTPAEDTGVQVAIPPYAPNATPPFPFFDSLSVFKGERSTLESVACGLRSAQRFSAHPGVTYHIMASFPPSAELRLSALALPPAPANDDFDAATVVHDLPFSDAIDTRGAMFQPEPGHCSPPSFGGGGIGAVGPPTNVWYAYTPTEDTRVTVDTSGSNYTALSTAFSGRRGALAALGCDPARFTFTALAGQTYHAMIAGSLSTFGDLLQVVMTGRPVLRIHVAIDAAGGLDLRTGSAFIDGAAMCSRPAQIIVEGILRQDRRRVQGRFRAVVACDGTTPWRATVTPDASRNGPRRFAAGAAEAVVHASGAPADDPGDLAVDDGRSPVILKSGPPR